MDYFVHPVLYRTPKITFLTSTKDLPISFEKENDRKGK